MSPRPDVIVVGAGIVGAACAEALARDGLRVQVLEAGFVGCGTTAAGMGHLVVMDDSDAQLALTSQSLRLWAERAPELPDDCEDTACGTLWLAADEQEMEPIRRKAAAYATCGVASEVLDERSLREAEPSLRPGLAGALLVSGDRVLYPPNAARALVERACARGAELHEGVSVGALRPRAVDCSLGRIEADLVVNAAGADAPRLTPGLPVTPRKGHLVITDRYPGLVRHQVVEMGYLRSAHRLTAESIAFNLQPRKTGQVLVGSSRELVGWDDSLNRPLLARMLRRACEFVPALSALRALRAWTGFRPATPDALPLLGRWEDGLFVATGHEGLGITTALATGRLIADLAQGRSPALDPAPFDPRRPMPAHA